MEIYVNEPAECKWSHSDQDYGAMSNQMSCATSVTEHNAQMLYTCSTTLTGLKDNFENDFYFRCKDNPTLPDNERNENAQSFPLTLIGTKPLVINSVEPNNEIIKDSTSPIKVELKARTSQGFDQGRAFCYFSDTGNINDYVQFVNSDSHEHSQELFFSEGDYEYFVRCVDLGGNADEASMNFTIEIDETSPKVVRAYREDNFLKIITDEEATCVYTDFGCSYTFDEGTSFTTISDKNHFTTWNPSASDLYVKCRDKFGNEPLPNQCNLVVRASEF
jgi:hypothetical protein